GRTRESQRTRDGWRSGRKRSQGTYGVSLVSHHCIQIAAEYFEEVLLPCVNEEMAAFKHFHRKGGSGLPTPCIQVLTAQVGSVHAPVGTNLTIQRGLLFINVSAIESSIGTQRG